MKSFPLQSRVLFAFVAVLFAVAAINARAATCSVPTDHPTIQSAVDDPNCTTVSVAAGVYNENVTISRSLTVNGAQAGQDFAVRTASGPDESVVRGANPVGPSPVFLINAANVMIDGFTIQDAVTASAAIGVQVKTAGSDAVLMNNIFDGISSADAGGNAAAAAVYLENGPDNVNISGNAMQNITSSQSATGVWIGNRAATDPSDDVLIKGNSFTKITSTAQVASALLVDNGAGVGGGARPQVRNNNISELTGAVAARGLDLETNTGFSEILDNNFSNLHSVNVAAIRYNYATFYQTEIHSNNFNLPTTAYGVEVDPAIVAAAAQDNPMNAACNWWGSPDGPGPVGPGHGARVSRLVMFGPWRIAPAPDGECTGNNVPTTENQCKLGGWIRAVRTDGSTFKNQGDCIQFITTGK